MKSQYKGSASKDNPKEFCFNWGLASKSFKLYGNRETFYKDIKVLIDTGFIDCVENNRNLRQKNVYRFSDRWKSQ